MFVCGRRGDAAARCALQEAALQEERFVHIHDRVGLVAEGGSDGFEADRTAIKLRDDAEQHGAVRFVQPECVDVEHSEGCVSRIPGDDARTANLGVVAHAAQQAVGDARRAARTAGKFRGGVGVDFDVQQFGGAGHNPGERFVVVELEAKD